MRVLSMFKGWAMTLAATSQIKHFLTERRAITKGKQLCFTDTHTHTHAFSFSSFVIRSLLSTYLNFSVHHLYFTHVPTPSLTTHNLLSQSHHDVVFGTSSWFRPHFQKKKNRGGAISWPSRKYMCICSISSQPPKISLFKQFNWEWNVSWTDHNHKTLGLKNVLFFPTPHSFLFLDS